MEYCIWIGAAQSSFSSLDRVQKHLWVFVGDKLFFTLQPVCHRWNVASLSPPLCCYFHGKGSNELHSLVPSILTFMAKTCHAAEIVANHSHSLRIPFVRHFTRTASFCEPLVCGTGSQEGVFLVTTILSYLNLVLTVIFSIYLHKLCLLHCNPLPRVSPEPWTQLKRHLPEWAMVRLEHRVSWSEMCSLKDSAEYYLFTYIAVNAG